MKRTLLWLLLVLLTIPFANAQNYEWDFGNNIETFPITASRERVVTINNLTIVQGPEETSFVNMGEIRNTAKTFEGIRYNNRFKFNGGGYLESSDADTEPLVFMPTQRYISFPVNGDCTVTALIITASSGKSRKIFVTDGTKLIGTMTTLATSDVSKISVNYTGPATTLYMYCNNGADMYYLEVKGADDTGINYNSSDKVIASVEYYDITGRKVPENTQGLILKKIFYNNGTSEVVKSIVK